MNFGTALLTTARGQPLDYQGTVAHSLFAHSLHLGRAEHLHCHRPDLSAHGQDQEVQALPWEVLARFQGHARAVAPDIRGQD